jgi:hypothetical protein
METPMTARYCLGMEHAYVAGAINPADFNLTHLQERLAKLVNDKISFERVMLTRAPSFTWTNAKLASHVLMQLSFRCHEDAKHFFRVLEREISKLSAEDRPRGHRVSLDPTIFACDAWPALGPDGGIFADRDWAERLAGIAGGLHDRSGKPVTGEEVNVVIVDRGLSRIAVQDIENRMAARRRLKTANQRTLGWTRYERGAYGQAHANGRIRAQTARCIHPGQLSSTHGQMIARNVLAAAPHAVIWDAPLLPSENEPDAPPTPSSVCQLFHEIRQAVRDGKWCTWDSTEGRRIPAKFALPVVIVNAWGVMNPEADPDFASYADNPDNFLVNDMTLMDKAGIDVVFAAGNCGEPCPDARCGLNDCGPGRSIYGMNGHPDVLTVGAVRADGFPLALSAQGPGRLYSMRYKPDLCAPSHFREADNAAELNTGTSAACGFAAGILTALRSTNAGRKRSPGELRAILRDTADKRGIMCWDPRLGFGIINGAAALAAI